MITGCYERRNCRRGGAGTNGVEWSGPAGGGGISSPGVGELFVLYADPASRGRRIGSALLSAVTEPWVRLVPRSSGCQ